MATTAMGPGNEEERSLYHNSSTGNWTEEHHYDYYDELRKSLKIMVVTIGCLSCVLGVLGNSVVIWVAGFKMKKTVNSVWFLNLAVTDFLFTAFLPLSITMIAMDFHWPFGKFMCKLTNTVSYLNMFASIYFLVVISVDRCVSVVYPIWAQTHRSVRRASGVSLGVWLLALVLSSPYFVFMDTRSAYHDENVTYCYSNFADDEEEELRNLRRYATYISRFLLGFLVPVVIIIFVVSCNTVIIHRLRKTRSMSGHTGRPFKIITAVIATFFLCCAPYHILELIVIASFMANHYSAVLYIIIIGFPITTSLYFLNSCLNPLLYIFVGQDFKDRGSMSILKLLENAFTEEVPRTVETDGEMLILE